MVLQCPIPGCNASISSTYAFRLREHVESCHADTTANFDCSYPGCGVSLNNATERLILDHFCSHLRYRDNQSTESANEQWVGTQAEYDIFAQAEEALFPMDAPIPDWLVNFTLPPANADPTVYQKSLSPLTATEKSEFDFLLFEIRHSITQQAHADLMNTILFKEAKIPKFPDPQTLRARFWSYATANGLGIEDLRTQSNTFSEPVPFFSVIKCVRLWLAHPILSEVAVDISNSRTKPYLLEKRNPPAPVIFSSTADGSEWLSPFLRTRGLWEDQVNFAEINDTPVIFLHLLLFGDGVPLWKSKQKGFEVVTSTLAEFNEGLRSSAKCPAILMNLMASKQMVNGFFQGYDGLLKVLTRDLNELIQGKVFYCAQLQKSALVVTAFHGFESDLIGRCKAGGFKQANLHSKAFCNVCRQHYCQFATDVLDENDPILRDSESTRARIREIQTTENYQLRLALMDELGISRVSEMWNFPGADLTRQLVIELMHLHAEGEICKHFEKFSAVLSQGKPNFWKNLSTHTKEYFKGQGGHFDNISSWELWRWSLNAADRLKFFQHSTFLLCDHVPQDKQDNWKVWILHVRLVNLSIQHTISKAEVLELGEIGRDYVRLFALLYGDDELTPNSHWVLHIQEFVWWFGVLRALWTFPQESILFQAKKSTRKMTNHKNVAMSCLALFLMERLLSQFLDPADDIPKKNFISMKALTEISSLHFPAHITSSLPSRVRVNPVVTHNYQHYAAGKFSFHNVAGYLKIITIVAGDTDSVAKCQVHVPLGEKEPVSQLLILQPTATVLYVSVKGFSYLCNVVHKGTQLLVNFENK